MRLTLAGLVAAWLFACGGEPRPAPATTPRQPAAPTAPAAAAPSASAAQAAPDPAANAAWSEASFDARLLAAIRSRFPQATVTALEADRYRIAAAPPGASVDIEFAKAHGSCRSNWASCQAAVDWTLRAVAEAMQPPPITAAQLRAVLRANSKVAMYRTQGELVVRPFSGDAQWLLVADLPTTIRLRVNPVELGMTVDQAWRTASDNMRKPPEALISGATDAAVVYHDVYAPSSLLDPAALEQAVRIRFPRRTGALLAVCPDETVVLYTLGDRADAAELRAAAAHLASQMQQPVLTQVMEWSHGAWQPVL
jgi:hypothetical protein